LHDEAERASRKAMAIIVPETNDANEVKRFVVIVVNERIIG
jgi:hypothetical protein